jgi:hypothetical protein
VARIIGTTPDECDWALTSPGVRNETLVEFVTGDRAALPVPLLDATLAAYCYDDPKQPPVMTAAAEAVDPANGRFKVSWSETDVAALLGDQEHWFGSWSLELLESGETVPIAIARGRLSIERKG